jgi:predicted nucleic acid-binding protein
VIKLLIEEADSDLAAMLWDGPLEVASSILCYPEARAALAGAARARRLSAAGYRDARAELESVHNDLLSVGVDTELARYTGKLADDLALRGYDAVHLASALALGAGTTVVSWDRDLRRAAAHSGCAIAPAELTP